MGPAADQFSPTCHPYSRTPPNLRPLLFHDTTSIPHSACVLVLHDGFISIILHIRHFDESGSAVWLPKCRPDWRNFDLVKHLLIPHSDPQESLDKGCRRRRPRL